MTDLRERVPAQALMEKLVSLRGTPDVVQLPFGIVKLSKDGVSWLRGINGELQMARRLRGLGAGWTVLHSIPVGNRGSDIDHVVVGPAGVFPINAKRLRDRTVWVGGGRFLVDGRKNDYLRNSDYEASRVEAVLRGVGIDIPVTPVIAISGARLLTVRGEPTWNGRSIDVASVEAVARRIRRRTSRFSPAQVDQIVAVFSDPGMWSTKSAATQNPSAIREAFDQIERGVTRWNILVGSAAFACVLLGLWIASLVVRMLAA